jgi:hypothetical protein
MNDKEFENFLKNCYIELQNKQKKITNALETGNYDEYRFDMENKTIQFFKNEKITLQYEFVFIGSWAEEDETWMWAWANDSLDEKLRKDSEAIKNLQNKTGFDEFIAEEVPCDDSMAFELVAAAVHELKAKGMYMIPGEDNEFYIALM